MHTSPKQHKLLWAKSKKKNQKKNPVNKRSKGKSVCRFASGFSAANPVTCSVWRGDLTSDAWHQPEPHSHVNTPIESRVITVMCNYTLITSGIIHDYNFNDIWHISYIRLVLCLTTLFFLLWFSQHWLSMSTVRQCLILMLLIGSSLLPSSFQSPNSWIAFLSLDCQV